MWNQRRRKKKKLWNKKFLIFNFLLLFIIPNYNVTFLDSEKEKNNKIKRKYCLSITQKLIFLVFRFLRKKKFIQCKLKTFWEKK